MKSFGMSNSEPGVEPVGVHEAVALHLHLAAVGADGAAQGVQQHLGLVGHLDPHGLPGGLVEEGRGCTCIRDATFTVSSKRQQRGVLLPTTW